MKQKVVYIPYVSNHCQIIAAAFRRFGIKAKLMKYPTKETFTLSKTFLSSKECLPCSILIGDLIATITQDSDFDPYTAVFYTPLHRNFCRYGQFMKLERLIFEKLGYPNLAVYDIDLTKQSKDDLLSLKNKLELAEIIWEGIVAIDCLDSWLYRNRPHAERSCDIDCAYNIAIDKLCSYIERGNSVLTGVKAIIPKLESYTIKEENRQIKPVIGITGELFARFNKFSNNNLVANIEHLGGECRLTPLFFMDDWFKYSFVAPPTTRYQYIDAKIKDFYQDYISQKIIKCFIHLIPKECHSSKKLSKYIKPYFNNKMTDEVVLILGKTIDYFRTGVQGVIEVMPYTCMFGNIALTIIQKIQEDFNNAPFLSFTFDGLEQVILNNRLEAFIYQCKNRLLKGD